MCEAAVNLRLIRAGRAVEAGTLLGLEDGGQTRLPLPPRGWCPARPAPAEPGLCLLRAHRQVPPLVWKKLCPDLILLGPCGFTSSPRNFKACSAFIHFIFPPPEVTVSSISSEPGITELFPSPVTVGSLPWLLSLASFSALQPALLGFWNVAFIVLLGLLCIRAGSPAPSRVSAPPCSWDSPSGGPCTLPTSAGTLEDPVIHFSNTEHPLCAGIGLGVEGGMTTHQGFWVPGV